MMSNKKEGKEKAIKLDVKRLAAYALSHTQRDG